MNSDHLDLLTAIGSLDPAASAHSTEAVQLAGIRRVVDARRAVEHPHHRPLRRRWRWLVALTAGFTALPVVVTIAVPDLVARLRVPWVAPDVLGSATAGGGVLSGLSCGGGYARAVRPDTAPIRLWPAEIPAGWSVRQVFANQSEWTGWCTPPSLRLVRLTDDGTVTARVEVTGPSRDIRWDGEPRLRPTRLAGLPAREVTYPGMGQSDFHRWVVEPGGGNQWVVESIGLTEVEARTVAEGLRIDDANVAWTQGDGPEMTVLDQRVGRPYPNRVMSSLEWYLELHDGRATRSIEIRRREPQIFPIELGPGCRLYRLGGRSALMCPDGRGRPNSLSVEVQPGVIAWADVRGDRAEVERLLLSLTDLPKDDPRLDRYATNQDAVPWGSG